MRKVVVLGCGFGGYHAAKLLEEELAGRRRIDLTLVCDQSHFVFSPLLAQVATGRLDQTHISMPLLGQFKASTNLIFDSIQSIDTEKRMLVADQRTIAFDYLIAAPGAQLCWQESIPWSSSPWARWATPIYSLKDATSIRQQLDELLVEISRLLEAPDDINWRQILSFAVIGAGARGIEFATSLCVWLTQNLLPLLPFEAQDAFRFYVIDRNNAVLSKFSPQFQDIAQNTLREMAIDILLDHHVSAINDGYITFSNREKLAAQNIFWCGGICPSPLISKSSVACDDRGLAIVDEFLQAQGHYGIYIIGDAATPPNATIHSAHLAHQQARTAVNNLLADLAGRSKRSFAYQDRGIWIQLGPDNALVSMGKTVLDGRSAQLLYRLFHAAIMPKPFKKARILKDWLALSSAKIHPRLLAPPSSNL